MTQSIHQLSNGDTVWVDSFSGTVIDSSEQSNTLVHQGRDRIQAVGGNLVSTPGEVYSQVVTTHKIWLKAADGTERQFDLSDLPLPVRQGHNVTLAWIGKQGKETGTIVAATNHVTGERCLSQLKRSLIGRVLELKTSGAAGWWVGGVVWLLCTLSWGTGGFIGGIVTGFVAICIMEIALNIYGWATKTTAGPSQRAAALLSEIKSIVEARLRSAEASVTAPEH